MNQPVAETTWPRILPFYRVLALVLAAASTLGLIRLAIWHASPLERFYLPDYAKLAIARQLPKLPPLPGAKPSDGRENFKMVFCDDFIATPELLQSGAGKLSVKVVRLQPATFEAWLSDHVYRVTLFDFLRPAFIAAGISFVLFFLMGAWLDRRRNNAAKNGRLIRGPRLVSRFVFNIRTLGTGLRFPLTNRRNLIEAILGERGRSLILRRNREAHHIQIAGDTGAGKSTLFREILYQVERRGDTAIIFDPDRQYIQEFYRASRGDVVLNPKDDRCPNWYIGGEAKDEAEATALAVGLFPDEPTTQKFFVNHTRAIFAYLLAKFTPTVQEFAYWMAHDKEIDVRVKGTEHEVTLTRNAAPQRAGVLGNLNEAGKAFRMMPGPEDNRPVFTITDWAKQRRGWIFVTSTPDTIDAVRPLQSLWLDMLILKLQSGKRPALLNWFGRAQRFCGFRPATPILPRVWLMIDELADLNALPQLHKALTKQRKSGNPICLGFQGMSQLDALYGKKAETILSQAFTNFVLRTREPRAAEHLSKLIGKAQIERVRESKPAFFWQWRSRSYYTERVVDPVVMDSEIQTLDDLQGFFVQQDKIVRIGFKPRRARLIAADLIERVIPGPPETPAQPETEEPPNEADRSAAGPWRSFESWCEGRCLPALPATSDTVALFIVTMANANRRPAAIFRTLAAVSQRHKDAKQDDPTSFNHEAVARAWESAKPKPATFVPSDASVAPPQANIGVAN
jgi:type IV secretory pathway TraG/TraD family ATPase VirD4